jgi:hypothetical protein
MQYAVTHFHLEELQAAAHEWYRNIHKHRLYEVIRKLRRRPYSEGNAYYVSPKYLTITHAILHFICRNRRPCPNHYQTPLVTNITAYVTTSRRSNINYTKLLNYKHNGLNNTKELEFIFRTSKIFTELMSKA